MNKIFTSIYESKYWGDNKNTAYDGSSGEGSSISYNIRYISFLKVFIISRGIKSIVDLGCGDFKCGPAIYDNLNIDYTGYDTYDKVINYNKYVSNYNFIHLDFYSNKEEIQGGDLCIIKDVLQHWELKCIYEFLDYLIESRKFKYILIVNDGNQTMHDTDIKSGDWRPLSYKYYPLKKYNFCKLFAYETKEVSYFQVK